MFNDYEVPLRIDVPVQREIVRGREVTVARADSGDEAPLLGNRFGFENTSSLEAAALYLRNPLYENDLLARGLNLGFCDNGRDAAFSGGISQDHLVRLLADARAPGCAERGYSLEDLAQNIESGAPVIALVNAAELWDCVDEPSLTEANHAVLIEGVVREIQSEEIAGFIIRDPDSSGNAFVDADKVTRMWLDAGGWQIVFAPAPHEL
jgi:hypothetical protein